MPRRGRPRTAQQYTPHNPPAKLSVPDVDFGGTFEDIKLVEPLPGGSADEGVAHITDSSCAAPEPPAPRATITNLRIERIDARQAATEIRLAKLLAENPELGGSCPDEDIEI